MKKFFLIIILLIIGNFAFSQELNCRVSVNYSALSQTPTPVFQSLQKDISQFVNETKWTNHHYEENEKIECNMLISITEYNGVDRFSASIQINLSRPIYGTSYNSPLFTFKEPDGKFTFTYLEGQSLDYVENMFTSNLTQVLAYYAYLILGYDYDTFSRLGGTEYFQKAFKIVLNSQTSGFEGWSSADSKQNSRYNLLDALLDKRFESLRVAQYQYHRLGMDLLPQEPTTARKNMIDALKNVRLAERSKSNSLIVSLFFTAKSDEIVNVFKEAQDNEKNEVMLILKEVDVANSAKYQKIKE